ncbi:MAG TPA: lysophospholipid acyltransferase family protein [Anaerolineaceae bacterium]|nr:lysophospholipid acyltransferase family protein [Anaerolineaceae bacterium]
MLFLSALYWLMFLLLGTYTLVRFNLRISRPASMPQGAKIFVANHPSVSDPFLLSFAIRQHAHILIAEEVFNIRPFGTLLRSMGFIPVIPHQGRLAFDQAVEYLQQGRNVMIFPEGHISPLEGGFLAFHSGAARLALATGAPIIPAGIHIQRTRIKTLTMKSGSEEIPAHWYFNGPYAITFGEPMYFDGDLENRSRVEDVTRTLQVEIQALTEISMLQMDAEFGNPVLVS